MEAAARTPVIGPAGYTGIAIIGSAPSSARLAPYNDAAWSIWGCSPGAYGVIPHGRSHAYFEIHRWEPPVAGDPNNPANRNWFSPEYCQFLKEHKGPVFVAGPDPQVDNPVPALSNGWRFPFEDYIAKYGPYFFTSSMAWMLAHAIELLAPRVAAGEKVRIGLWGVDMAALTEYNLQRPGCQHFLGIAKKLGIEVVLPPESDLLQPPTLYGISEYHPRHTKLLARMNEIQGREQQLAQQVGQLNTELMHVRGALDNMKYIFATWIDDTDPGMDITGAVSMAGVIMSRPEPIEAALTRFEPAPPPPPWPPSPISSVSTLGSTEIAPKPPKRKPKRR